MHITTTSEEEIKNIVQADFRKIQEDFVLRGVRLTYDIREQTKEIPHYRKVHIRSEEGNYAIWLDRGLNIFTFDDLEKPIFSTLDTYIVLERTS